MPNRPRRLPDIVQAMLEKRGWHVSSSTSARPIRGKDHSQLVFVGNWQDPCPRRLLFDTNLEPVDIVAWQVIRVHADATGIVAFPAYADLMRAIGVSRATIARALAVLRLTRWLPLCATVRDPQGRFAGHVYALNDEPLPLGEIFGIDEGYVAFTEQARGHRNAHVRALAQHTLESIREAAIEPESAVFEPLRLCEHVGDRLAQLLHLFTEARTTPRTDVEGEPAPAEPHRVQNLNAVGRVQNLNSAGSSSIKKTTTTRRQTRAATAEPGPKPGEAGDQSSLVFPSALSLTDSQRRVLMLRLEQVPTAVRQDILDEAAGRILAKRLTTDPVRCEFDYVARLCARALDGQFVLTDAGERVRRDRAERADAEQRLKRARAYSEAQRLKALKTHQDRRNSE